MAVYHIRSTVEAVFSSIKRCWGPDIKSIKGWLKRRELAIKVLAYTNKRVLYIEKATEWGIPPLGELPVIPGWHPRGNSKNTPISVYALQEDPVYPAEGKMYGAPRSVVTFGMKPLSFQTFLKFVTSFRLSRPGGYTFLTAIEDDTRPPSVT
jgi:hypothetical protein